MTRQNEESIPPPPDRAAAPSVFQTLDRGKRFPYSGHEYAWRFAWLFVQATLFRWSPARLNGWRRFLLRLFGANVGHSAIHPTARIMHPWLLTLGEWSNIGPGVTVYNLGAIAVGDHTLVSQDAYLCAGTHDHTDSSLPLLRRPITIGSGVWIAAGVFVGPDVTIGDNSVVGARSVVVKDVPPGVVGGGNPFRVVKEREMTLEAISSLARVPESDRITRHV